MVSPVRNPFGPVSSMPCPFADSTSSAANAAKSVSAGSCRLVPGSKRKCFWMSLLMRDSPHPRPKALDVTPMQTHKVSDRPSIRCCNHRKNPRFHLCFSHPVSGMVSLITGYRELVPGGCRNKWGRVALCFYRGWMTSRPDKRDPFGLRFSTQVALQTKLAVLEDGEDALVLASGVAALHAVFFSYLNTGDHIVVADVTYEATCECSRSSCLRSTGCRSRSWT